MTLSERADIIKLMNAGLAALRANEQEINSLNVFPVPDGDTGTNLVMTIDTVADQLSHTSGNDRQELLKTVILGSLMGARGNSGVIMSQIVRGVCERLSRPGPIDAPAIAEALENAVRVAYQAIRKPVEGTMLTVIRDAARKASEVVEAGEDDIGRLLDLTLKAAGESVTRTPELLPVLKEAGVVDAGGYGLVVFGQGLATPLLGRVETPQALVVNPGTATGEEEADLSFRYCTEFIVPEEMDVEGAEEYLATVGGSIMVAAFPGLTRIHVHTNSPGKVLDWASRHGAPDQVKINDMAEQVRERRSRLAGRAPAAEGTGVVAVANGEGVVRILESLGVDEVVDGGQTMNPSAAQLVHAVEDAPHENVILLPNNPNIILTAQQVQQLTTKQIAVVPTKTLPEGFAALLALQPEAGLRENEKSMSRAASAVKTGEMTRAVRSGQANGVKFGKGDYIGISGGSIAVAGRELGPTLAKLLQKIVSAQDSSITLIFGAEVDDKEAERIAKRTRKKYGGLDLDVQQGGQPLYPVIVGVE